MLNQIRAGIEWLMAKAAAALINHLVVSIIFVLIADDTANKSRNRGAKYLASAYVKTSAD